MNEEERDISTTVETPAQGSITANAADSDEQTIGAAPAGGGSESQLAIGVGIPDDDLPRAARLYHEQGFTVVPAYGPSEGSGKQMGKAPKVRGYMSWTPADLDEGNFQRYWPAERPSNILLLLKGADVVIDVDSKRDQGVSARAWVDAQCALASFPRENTPNGVHLHARCPDLPPFTNRRGQLSKDKLVSEHSEHVTFELLYARAEHTVVVSPSIHPTGNRYSWAHRGERPVCSWARLQEVFGFAPPGQRQAPTQSGTTSSGVFHLRYRGDLGSLEIVALCREAAIYGRPVDSDSGRHSVQCPFRHEHSDADSPSAASDTSSVVFEARQGSRPGFKCQHAHCSGRGLAEFLEAIEQNHPGIVDRHCLTQRLYEPGQRSADGRPRVVLPGPGRPQLAFALDVVGHLAASGRIYYRSDHVVEVRDQHPGDVTGGQKLDVIEPVAAVTRFEQEIEFGKLQKDQSGGVEFVPDSITKPEILLKSSVLRQGLPPIMRILQIPVPVIHQGDLVFPRVGHDPRFDTFVAGGEGAWFPTRLSRDEAFSWLNELLGNHDNLGFCWEHEQSFVHAVARVITPMCRGLMGWAKTPVFIFTGNRPRVGKDEAAQIPMVLYTGQGGTYAPLGKDSDDEMRKRITSCLRSGQAFLHISNMRGDIIFPSLEMATDNNRVFRDRLLGKNIDLKLVNETEYSFSANSGTTWTPDIEGRCRRIGLFYPGEDINARRFRHTDLKAWVLQHRDSLLNAVYTLICEWNDAGRPDGPTPFASFPEWGGRVGGVMHVNDLGNPCLPHVGGYMVGGNSEDEEMKRLFELARERYGDEQIRKEQLYELIAAQEEPLFGYLDVGDKAGQTRFGTILKKYQCRDLSGVRLVIDNSDRHRLRYRFLDAQMQTLQTLQTFVVGLATSNNAVNAPMVTPEADQAGINEEAEAREGGDRPVEVCKVCEVCTPATRPRAADMLHFPRAEGYVCVTEESQFDHVLNELRDCPLSISLNVETYSNSPRNALDPWNNPIRLISIGFERKIYLIDVAALGHRMAELTSFLADKVLIAHNARFNMLTLLVKYGLRPKAVVCTRTLSQILAAGNDEANHTLGSNLDRHLGIGHPDDQGDDDWGREALSAGQLQYAADGVRYLYQLAVALLNQGRDENLHDVMKLETDLITVLTDMEFVGFPADRDRLAAMISEHGAIRESAAAEARDLLPDSAINLNSQEQLINAFAALSIDLADTTDETFRNLNHPAAEAILRYRGAVQLLQQAQSYIAALDQDSRIHTKWNSTSIRTGRIGSKEPSLQNVARGELRTAFRPPTNRKFVIADYSQIELRVAAFQAKDPVMIQIFRNGEDIHRKTAAAILNKNVEDVTSDERQKAKAVNFGFLYGQRPKGFVAYARKQYGVVVSESEAESFHRSWFSTFPGISNWHVRCEAEAKSSSRREARTVLQRRRILPGLDNSWSRLTTLLNTPVQGTAGDGLKRALLRLSRELPEGSHVVASIHDEIIVECPDEAAVSVMNLIQQVMKVEMAKLLLDEVPIEVSASVCDSWADKQ